jgi:tetratricopeptide (TPR) repeat protein
MGENVIKIQLMDLVEEAHSKEIAYWDALSDTERARKGKADRWAPKDVLAHISYWNNQQAKRLEAAILNETPDDVQDYEKINQEIFQKNRDRSWEELLQEDEQTFDRLKASIAAIPNDMIDDPQLLAWTNARPLWWNVAFTAYYHVLGHLSSLYSERGKAEEAKALHEHIARGMMSLSEGENWKGTTIYNLACFYALNDYHDLALDELRKAFVLNPDLVEWSKEDSDLDQLRHLPAFQALFDV